ncbi:cytochrome P450 [Lenzites betulinus]|nr:cytochrome P450 [Lenzites betulinus]
MANLLGTPISILDLGVVCFTLLTFVYIRRRSRLPLPPGPPGLPLIGNTFDFPALQPWVAHRDFSLQYGDVVALHALGQTLIVLNSVTAATDLLDKRSAIYSDRPDSIITCLIGWDWNLGLKRYDDSWRRVRRMFWKYFQPSVVTKFQHVQQHEARLSLGRLLDSKDDLDKQLKLGLSKTILTAVHGLPGEEATTRFVDILKAAEDGIAEAFTQGQHLVEYLPWLQYVPGWVPGTGWQRKVVRWTKQVAALRDAPFDAAWDARRRGVMKPSVLSELMEQMPQKNDKEAAEYLTEIKETTAVAYGGTFTHETAATLVAFVCAMILYPDVQKRAQAELDAVVGQDRLPEQTDRAALPYVWAIVKELLRWHNVAPLGVPHRCMEEDVYRGWRIPKGSVVMANAWAMLHDPEVYPEPEEFRPERFLNKGETDEDVLDPTSVMFGFGRRICPGKRFAEDTLFINAASILHVFNILPALDEHGNPIPVTAKMTSGLLSYQEEFKYSFKPRFKGAEALIRGDVL